MDNATGTPKQTITWVARTSCRKCYGRGYVGTDQEGNKVRCRCLKAIKPPGKPT